MCPSRVPTGQQEPVKIECPIQFWLSMIGFLILGGFGAVTTWNAWLTVRQSEQAAAIAAEAAAGKVLDDNTAQRLNEMRDDIKELLRRNPSSRVSSMGGGG